jgi:hypothetical protein
MKEELDEERSRDQDQSDREVGRSNGEHEHPPHECVVLVQGAFGVGAF